MERVLCVQIQSYMHTRFPSWKVSTTPPQGLRNTYIYTAIIMERASGGGGGGGSRRRGRGHRGLCACSFPRVVWSDVIPYLKTDNLHVKYTSTSNRVVPSTRDVEGNNVNPSDNNNNQQ